MVHEAQEWPAETAREVWRLVNRGALYDWPVAPSARLSLGTTMPDVETRLLAGSAEASRGLRLRLSGCFHGASGPVRAALAAWIVRDWGGIRTNGAETVALYLSELADFGPESVESFVIARRTIGISSWSKILAFAFPDSYAIYDARTAVALNCVLSSIGVQRRFAMPPSRNNEIRSAIARIRSDRRGAGLRGGWLGYRDYMALLRTIERMPDEGRPSDLLACEMAIFANAPKIAREFCAATSAGC